MSLSINKEQVLALLAIAIGAWIYSDLGQTTRGRSTYNPNDIELEIPPVPKAPLVEGPPAAGGRRDLFTEPRETRPLPPRALDFPPRSPASVVALPLALGPDYRNLVRLAIDGSVVEGAELTVSSAGSDGGGAAAVEVQDPPDRAERFEQAKKTYDQVWLEGQRAPLLGIVEVVGVDPFDAEKMTDFSQHEVRLRRYLVDDDRLGGTSRYRPGEVVRVVKIQLADNLKNTIERRRRAIPRDGAHLDERAELIVDLLEWARDDVSVYDDALEQAEFYYQDSDQSIEGLRWKQRVLQARGDLAGEFDLLQGTTQHKETAFRYEGLGRLQARLGLVIEAEENLERAVELAPTDARPHAALAEFLLAQGRSREAVAAAGRAERAWGSLIDDGDKARVVRVLVACHLAVGDVDAARNARGLASASITPRYVDGCIAYTAGELERALELFQSASAAVSGGREARNEAKLGEAATLLRLLRWQEAADAFVEVYEDAPLLRHRAASGMSLLHQRLGDLETALSWVDRAIEADPEDAYAHYLRGRGMRLSGQLQSAEEAVETALRAHDDFVHAILEMARLFGQRAESAIGEDQASLLIAAMRYSDRAVALSPVDRAEFYEFQGLRHVAAADPRGAMTAFERARDAATTEAGKMFARGALAVVEYGLGRVDDAVAVLLRMSEDISDKDDPIRQWAEETVAAIDDHAQKEMLEDRFERSEVGSIWLVERDGPLGATVSGGKLRFRDRFSRSGRGEVWAERASAVQKGKNFLAVGCTLELGDGQPLGSGFAGIRLQTQQGSSGRTDFKIELGVREGEPFLLVRDNREDTRLKSADLDITGFAPRGEHELEIRVLPQAKDEGRTFVLQVSWNGQIVHQRELKSLSGTTQTELKTILFAEGPRGSEVDVAFDDYVLERKKER